MRRMLDDALLHVRTRGTVEHSIVATAREQREQLEPGSRQAYQLAEIMELIETCRQQHLILERRLMEAPRIFFEEQERQIFTLRPSLLFPHPQNDLLAPLLNLSELEILMIYNAEIRGFLGYYSLADNLTSTAAGLLWLTSTSFYRTLAGKRKSTLYRVKKSMKRGPGHYVLTARAKIGGGVLNMFPNNFALVFAIAAVASVLSGVLIAPIRSVR